MKPLTDGVSFDREVSLNTRSLQGHIAEYISKGIKARNSLATLRGLLDKEDLTGVLRVIDELKQSGIFTPRGADDDFLSRLKLWAKDKLEGKE